MEMGEFGIGHSTFSKFVPGSKYCDERAGFGGCGLALFSWPWASGLPVSRPSRPADRVRHRRHATKPSSPWSVIRGRSGRQEARPCRQARRQPPQSMAVPSCTRFRCRSGSARIRSGVSSGSKSFARSIGPRVRIGGCHACFNGSAGASWPDPAGRDPAV